MARAMGGATCARVFPGGWTTKSPPSRSTGVTKRPFTTADTDRPPGASETAVVVPPPDAPCPGDAAHDVNAQAAEASTTVERSLDARHTGPSLPGARR